MKGVERIEGGHLSAAKSADLGLSAPSRSNTDPIGLRKSIISKS